jgi:hypothetical protein
MCFKNQNAMVIGADYYESDEQRAAVIAAGGVPLGIGENSVIENCIVDKNARIGKNVVIRNAGGIQVGDVGGWVGGWSGWVGGCEGGWWPGWDGWV